jgi:hypothetical protein
MSNQVTVSVGIPTLDQYEVRLLLHGMQVVLNPSLKMSMEFFEGVGESIVVTYPLGILLPKDVQQATRAVLRSIGRSEEPGEPQAHT